MKAKILFILFILADVIAPILLLLQKPLFAAFVSIAGAICFICAFFSLCNEIEEGLNSCSRSAYSETQKAKKELEEKQKHSNRLIQVLQNKINQLEKEIEALKQPKQEDDNT